MRPYLLPSGSSLGYNYGMTPEERFERIDRQFEFLAAQQAELNTIVQRNSEQIAEHSAQIAEHGAQIAQLTDIVSSVVQVLEQQGRRAEEFQRRTEERFKEVDERFKEVAERMNALIIVVERYFSDGRH